MISEDCPPFDLKTDSGFKTFFGSPCRESEYCLKSFLSALTRQNISSIKVANCDPESSPPLGITCIFENGKKARFEIQVINDCDSVYKRASFYTAKVSAAMASRSTLQKQASFYRIFITNFSSFSGKGFFKEFPASGEGTADIMKDSTKIMFIELPKVSGCKEKMHALNELEFWSMLIKDSRYMLASGTDSFLREKEMAKTILSYVSPD